MAELIFGIFWTLVTGLLYYLFFVIGEIGDYDESRYYIGVLLFFLIIGLYNTFKGIREVKKMKKTK